MGIFVKQRQGTFMIVHAFNLGFITLLFFLVGMFKPKWALFFLKKPDRFLVLIITTILFMITMTMYGAGTKELKAEKAAVTKKSTDSNSTPVPVPVPTPDKATTEKKP